MQMRATGEIEASQRKRWRKYEHQYIKWLYKKQLERGDDGYVPEYAPMVKVYKYGKETEEGLWHYFRYDEGKYESDKKDIEAEAKERGFHLIGEQWRRLSGRLLDELFPHKKTWGYPWVHGYPTRGERREQYNKYCNNRFREAEELKLARLENLFGDFYCDYEVCKSIRRSRTLNFDPKILKDSEPGKQWFEVLRFRFALEKVIKKKRKKEVRNVKNNRKNTRRPTKLLSLCS